MSYTLAAIQHLVKETPKISTDFVNVETKLGEKPMEAGQGEEEGEGLNQRTRDILSNRESTGRHQFMNKALRKWLSMPYRVCRQTPDPFLGRPVVAGQMHFGVINAAVAENELVDDLIAMVMQIPTMNHFKQEVTHYFDLKGTPGLRKALATFLSKQFQVEPDLPLNPDLMTVTNGAGPGMEMLVQVLTEPGYAWMSPTPHCKQMEYNLTLRGGEGATVPIPLTSRLDGGASKPFELTLRKVQIAYKLAMQRGKKIAGIILCNPHNPLGTIYSKELLMEILVFAKEAGLHVILDEVYALSLHEDVPFNSVSTFTNLPNPMTTHFIWSCSKDLALSGFRCGVVYSWNPYVNKALTMLSQFTAVPIPVQEKVETLLNTQSKFLEEIFIPYNQMRLQKTKDRLIERLVLLDIEVHHSDAGLFLWCNISKHLKEKTHEEELALCESMLLVGLWVVPGRLMDSVEPGWIRINFAKKQDEWVEFFKRFPKALEKYHTYNEIDEIGRFSVDNVATEDETTSFDGTQSQWWETESVANMLDDAESEIMWAEAQRRINEMHLDAVSKMNPDGSRTGSQTPNEMVQKMRNTNKFLNVAKSKDEARKQKNKSANVEKPSIAIESILSDISWGMPERK